MKKKPNTTYSRKIKDRAISRVVEHGASIRTAAKELGVPRSTLAGWLKKRKAPGPAAPARHSPRAVEQVELEVLREEVAALRAELDEARRAEAAAGPSLAGPMDITPHQSHFHEVGPHDSSLLDRSREQWQHGDWDSLVALAGHDLGLHPDRAKLALLAAAGYQQNNDMVATRHWLKLAQEWGCDKKLVARVLIAGVHNTLGRAAALGGQNERALRHFEDAVATGTPGSEMRVVAKARLGKQIKKLDRLDNDASTSFLWGAGKIKGDTNPTIVRTIHHMACTGGTLFTKCIAAMPNAVVLNEVNPFSGLNMDDANKPSFKPRDIITLLRQSMGGDDKLIADVFCNEIQTIVNSVSMQNKYLVLREHTHSSYMVGASDAHHANALRDTLAPRFKLLSLVTVRNPIDSYLSLREFNWIHFHPQTFDEYCRRYLLFLQDFTGVSVIRYEDFVSDSFSVMQSICNLLDIEYDPVFSEKFHDFKFSGDSGRGGDVIAPRERRSYDDKFACEVNESAAFKDLAGALGYPLLLGYKYE